MKTQEIADFLSAELVGDGDVEIHAVADINTASENEVAFTESADSVPVTLASCLIDPLGFQQNSSTP